MRKNFLVWFIAIWSALVIISFVWNFAVLTSNNQKVVLNKAESFFNQMLTTRAWASRHGGLYVPITTTTLPNPFLIDSLRDVETLDSLLLTKINPAYMTRQISEINKTTSDIQFHITSLNPIRPANKADLWETKILQLFEKNRQGILELVQNDTNYQYRYMAPLITENSCLNCHAVQGYKSNSVRGGISVSFPATFYLNMLQKRLIFFIVIHFLLLGFGIMGILYFYRMEKKYFSVIQIQNKELTNINATKDKLFSIVAHDLRSPFNNILGYSDLLVSDYDNLDEDKRREFTNIIFESSKGAFELVDNLLLWARSQRDQINIKKEIINLNELVYEALNPHLVSSLKKNIAINIDISEEQIIYADAFTMKTIIANLINNAIKFTPKNGKININAIQTDQIVEISITDNGIGIPPETIHKLFIANQTVSTIGTNYEKGTGLGLILCKELIEKNGGQISVESILGEGSKFILQLPEYIKAN